MVPNSNLLKLAQQMNPNNTLDKLTQSLGKIDAIKQNSLFNTEKIQSDIQNMFARIKMSIDAYHKSPNQQMVAAIQNMIQQIETYISFFAPGGHMEDPKLYATYQKVLAQYVAQIQPGAQSAVPQIT